MAGVVERTPQIENPRYDPARNRLQFELTGTDASVANALRRVIISEVPTLAIDKVSIETNETVMHDEFVAHRLGLIPIAFRHPDGDNVLPEDIFGRPTGDLEDDEDRDFLQFELEVEAGPDERIVTSRDINRALYHQAHEFVYIAHTASPAEDAQLQYEDHAGAKQHAAITIVKLGSYQKLKLTATAKLGTGKLHAKWNPVCVCSMRYEPMVEVVAEEMDRLTPAEKEEFVSRCMPGVFRYDDENDEVVVANKMLATNLDEINKLALELSHTDQPLIDAGFVPDKFLFDIETTGALTPHQVVRSGIQVLQRKLATLAKAVVVAGRQASQDVTDRFEEAKR